MRMLNLTLKNVPAELHAQLKARAESNRRSLNREIMTLLEAQIEAPAVDVASEQVQLERFVAAHGYDAIAVPAARDRRRQQRHRLLLDQR